MMVAPSTMRALLTDIERELDEYEAHIEAYRAWMVDWRRRQETARETEQAAE